MRFLSLTALFAVLIGAPAFASAARFESDAAHTSASFVVKHLMVTNVRGEFPKVAATLNYDEKDPTKSTVEATIEVASVTTRDAKRDAHLRSADFFDADKFPTITFKSTKVEKVGDGKLRVTGNLTIRGVTKEVVLDVDGPTGEIKDPWGNTKIGASASTRINRLDFGVKWNAPLAGGGLVVGEEVSITLDVEFNKKPDATSK